MHQGYRHFMEGGTAWYSANPYIQHTFMNYVSGFYGWAGIPPFTCTISSGRCSGSGACVGQSQP